MSDFDASTTAIDDLTGDYQLDPAHTRIGFVARHAMVTKVRGSFKEFEATVHLDAADPTKNGFRFEGPENQAREVAMVRRLLASIEPVKVVVLGADHDLGNEIKAVCPSCRYERIEPEAFLRAGR